ncbi:hypothetical protein GGR09_001175 [Bartonella heixiaziensis]
MHEAKAAASLKKIFEIYTLTIYEAWALKELCFDPKVLFAYSIFYLAIDRFDIEIGYIGGCILVSIALDFLCYQRDLCYLISYKSHLFVSFDKNNLCIFLNMTPMFFIIF